MDDLDVRLYQDGDDKQIVEFLANIFGDWPKINIIGTSNDHWNWKLKDNPVPDHLSIVCFDGSRLVGSLADYPRLIKIGDGTVKCGNSIDAAVHPDYRGKGIYRRMENLLEEYRKKTNEKIFNGIGGNPILVERTKRHGEEDFPAKITLLVRIHDVEMHSKAKNLELSLLEKLGYKGLQTISKMGSVLRKNTALNGLELVNVDKFNDEINTFWAEIKDSYQYVLVRDQQFLNWRYTDPRNGTHRIILAYEKDNIVGYCTSRLNTFYDGYPEGYIVDMMTHPDRVDIAETLLLDAITYFDENNVNIIYYMGINGRPELGILRGQGFVDSRSNFGVSLKAIDPKYATIVEELKNTDVSKLDYQYSHTDWI